MVRARLRWLRGLLSGLGLLAAALALACQIGAGGSLAVADKADPQTALLAGVSILCQSGQHQADQETPAPHRHLAGQILVTLVSAGTICVPLLDRPPGIPEPASGSLGGAILLPRTRAPPAHHVSAALPRGPPTLSGV